MTLEELQESVNKDFKLDDTELDRESVNIPLLHNKYLIHFNKFNSFNIFFIYIFFYGNFFLATVYPPYLPADPTPIILISFNSIV